MPSRQEAYAEDAGSLGVVGLRRFWMQAAASRAGLINPPSAEDLNREPVLLAGLRLGLRETLDFLATAAPSFEDFEAWVLAKNDGVLAPARLNAALRGDGAFTLETILAEPVLSAADLAFWRDNGYIVVKHAVDPPACQAAVDAIFEYAGVSLHQPDTWRGRDLWIPLAHHPALWANRNSPRIHTAFAQLWQRNDLWMNVDVCGISPPLLPGESSRTTPLHWDMSLALPHFFGTQSILYLTDTPAHQGAFSCVPGFHRNIEDWLRQLPPGVDPRAAAPRELTAIPIAGHAGDLIIWHHALPHCATPNSGTLPRVVQYLNMFPSQYQVNPIWL